MKIKLFAACAVGIPLFYASLSGTSQSRPAQPEIRFRLAHNTMIVVSIAVNGQGPFDFFLDTGVDTTIVDQSLADKLSLETAGQILQVSIGGRQTLRTSHADSLALGTAQIENSRVLIQNLAEFRSIDSHIQGILGQDFLAHFNYLLDYRRCSIRIEQGRDLHDMLTGKLVAIEHRKGKMVVDAESDSGRREALHLALDSGASTMVLMADATRRIQVPMTENRTELTATGYVLMHAGSLRLLKVGSTEFQKVRAILSSQPVQQFEDGLLPTTFFQALYINNEENYVIFNPGSKKPRSKKG